MVIDSEIRMQILKIRHVGRDFGIEVVDAIVSSLAARTTADNEQLITN